MKQTLLMAVASAACFLGVDCLWAGERLRVVTTLSAYADIAKALGGESLEVTFIAPPRFDPHFIEPRPSDVYVLKKADLFIHSGLDLEVWREPLVDAAARADLRWGGGRQLDLSVGISLLQVPAHQPSRAERDIHVYGNPHYWLDPRNGLIIAEEIAAKLSEIDPGRADIYQNGLQNFSLRLREKIGQWLLRVRPYQGRELVGYHNGWIYFTTFAGVKMDLFLEPKPGIPPSPKHLETVLSYINERKVPAIVQATFDPKSSAERLSAQTGVKIVWLCSNPGETPQCSDYISMFDYNIEQLAEAFSTLP